jgi:hypothetical protein
MIDGCAVNMVDIGALLPVSLVAGGTAWFAEEPRVTITPRILLKKSQKCPVPLKNWLKHSIAQMQQ